MISATIQRLAAKGWKIVGDGVADSQKASRVAKLLGCVNDELFTEWIGCRQSIQNNNDTIWFLLSQSYLGEDGSAFPWDFIRRLELEAAEGYDDLQAETRDYWATRIPVLLDVSDGCYKAIVASVENGKLVRFQWISAPEFRGEGFVANDFEDFLSRVPQILSSSVL